MNWLIVFEDTEMKPEVFDEEAKARQRFDSLQQNWDCHLFTSVRRIAEAVAAEREACAKIADHGIHLGWLDEIAAAIRARGET